jgi:hypothetical protein
MPPDPDEPQFDSWGEAHEWLERQRMEADANSLAIERALDAIDQQIATMPDGPERFQLVVNGGNMRAQLDLQRQVMLHGRVMDQMVTALLAVGERVQALGERLQAVEDRLDS